VDERAAGGTPAFMSNERPRDDLDDGELMNSAAAQHTFATVGPTAILLWSR